MPKSGCFYFDIGLFPILASRIYVFRFPDAILLDCLVDLGIGATGIVVIRCTGTYQVASERTRQKIPMHRENNMASETRIKKNPDESRKNRASGKEIGIHPDAQLV